jgi:hypothetical protein
LIFVNVIPSSGRDNKFKCSTSFEFNSSTTITSSKLISNVFLNKKKIEFLF